MKKLLVSLLISLSVWTMAYAQQPKVMSDSQTFVFVHGAWGGAWDYQNMEKLLEEQSHKVYRITLTGLGERAHLNNPQVNLDTHIMDVVNVFKYEQIERAVLIGHSYGGMVITGVADRIPNNIQHLVYADAMLPKHGESFFDLMPARRADWRKMAKKKGDGWKILPFWEDWGRDVPHPLGTLEQAISLTNPMAKAIPATYILTIEKGVTTDTFSPFAARAKKRGWPVIKLQTGHNLQRTMPTEYMQIILRAAGQND